MDPDEKPEEVDSDEDVEGTDDVAEPRNDEVED